MEESDNKEGSWHQGFIGQTSVSATSLLTLPFSVSLSIFLFISLYLFPFYTCLQVLVTIIKLYNIL